MSFTVKVLGLREVQRSLNQYAGAADDLKEANAKIGQKVAVDAKATAPQRTGRLAGSIRANRAKSSIQLKAGSSSVPYAGVIEYGWPARNIEAQPYLRRAAWSNIDYVIQEFEANLEGLKRKYIAN